MINHLLLIDDDVMVLKVNKLLVQRAQLAIKTTSKTNGQEGIEYLDELCKGNADSFPELIFLDIDMPFMNGWDFLDVFMDRFAEQFPKTKIAIITGSLDPNYLLKAYSYPPVLTFLQKPVQLDEICSLKKSRHLFQFFHNYPIAPETNPRGSACYPPANENNVATVQRPSAKQNSEAANWKHMPIWHFSTIGEVNCLVLQQNSIACKGLFCVDWYRSRNNVTWYYLMAYIL